MRKLSPSPPLSPSILILTPTSLILTPTLALALTLTLTLTLHPHPLPLPQPSPSRLDAGERARASLLLAELEAVREEERSGWVGVQAEVEAWVAPLVEQEQVRWI